MLEAKAGGSTESEPSKALLAFKPRQLLLAAHTKPTQMKKQNSKTLNSQEGVNILHSILCYLDSHGFPRSVKRILSEAQIENDGWKTHVHKLEDMRGSYLEKLSSKEAVTDTSKEQDDAAMKKKKSNQSDAISLSVADNSSIKSSKAPSDDTVLEHLVDESNLKQDKKKKRKTKSMPEAVDTKPGHVKFESQSQVDGKPTKDKKKKKGSSDSLVETSEQFKVAPEPVSEIPMVQKKDKSKEKRRKQEISDSDEVLAVRVDEVSHQDGLTTEKISEDAVDKLKKISKKRKRLESDTRDGKPVEELATNELKRLKTKATEETKSIEQLGYENELCKESEGQNGHVQNESKKSIVQEPEVNANDAHKTGKYQRNGSTEPRTVNAFQRVKVEEVEFVDDRLQDNSYWAKDGAEIGYGAKAQEVLGQVRGRDFRHEKTKKKRGSYRGGQIDLHSHSIKFNYDDEDD